MIRNTQRPSIHALAFLMTALSASAHAETTVSHKQFQRDTRVKTVGGTLAVRANKKDDMVTDVILKDKVVATIAETGLGFDHKFSVRGNDVVLLSHPSGAACPATYYFLMIAPDGKIAFSGNEGLGNCSDVPTVTYDDKAVTIAMPALGEGKPSKSKQLEKWTWDYSAKKAIKLK